MDRYLKETKMLDFNNINIQNLINERNWKKEDDFHKIQLIYNFIRDEILFGYNVDDNISASEVLKDGYGQCNTKGTFLGAKR